MGNEAFLSTSNVAKLLAGRAPSRTPLRELTALPKPPSWWGGGPSTRAPSLLLALRASNLVAFGHSFDAP